MRSKLTHAATYMVAPQVQFVELITMGGKPKQICAELCPYCESTTQEETCIGTDTDTLVHICEPDTYPRYPDMGTGCGYNYYPIKLESGVLSLKPLPEPEPELKTMYAIRCGGCGLVETEAADSDDEAVVQSTFHGDTTDYTYSCNDCGYWNEVGDVKLIKPPVPQDPEPSHVEIACGSCPAWEHIELDTSRYTPDLFTVVCLHDNGTAKYKCNDCDAVTRSVIINKTIGAKHD